ncbi:MAG: bifunctional folylpolyglutamate synthase/dihydrofolate synthase [Candidatus Hydrogenedentes bacterium]|nr:bifunctional folylpolyglutamate synthase/dihydrofolate synthase [Candidatus Hydrogenedentota bacterium]
MPPIDEMGRDSAGAAPSALQQYLFDLALFGVKLGLQHIERLLDAAGAPQRGLNIVHVAGTNGKGSVAAFLDAMFRAAGYRTGRFTSPHIQRVNERFVVNGTPISGAALDRHLAFFKAVAETMEPPPTFFEMNTAVALRCFAEERADIVLLEVGLGGRLDATNVVQPMLGVITNIDYEHQEWLGDTLAEIAGEKAGIIKEGTPVIVGERGDEALNVILTRAAQCNAPVQLLGRDFDAVATGDPWRQTLNYTSATLQLENVPLALAGRHQAANAGVALAAAEALQSHFPRLDAAAMQRGLATVKWPCRLERVMENPSVIIDVAHNPAGARILSECIGECVILLGVSADKDVDAMLQCLGPLAKPLIVSAFTGKRALPVEALAEKAAAWNPTSCATLSEAIALGISLATPERPLVITGSIYMAGEARALLERYWDAPPLTF